MEANKSDCEKCIKIAQSAASTGDYQKAIKFLGKAEKLYPSEVITKLSKEYTDLMSRQQQSQGQETRDPNDSYSNFKKDSSPQDEEYSNTNHTTHNRRKETAEQSDAVKRIKNCQDFYEMLGVPKTASDVDLKKAYKKMALQFHPDKNKSPGATDAFKAIGKAFSVLSDAQKRKQYDNYGAESFESGGGNQSRSTSHRQSGYHGSRYSWNEEEFSADELFNLFFGGNPGHAAARRRQQQQHHHQTHRQAGGNGGQEFQFTTSSLMPILLIIALSLISNFMIGEPAFNLQKNTKYSVKRTTNEHNVNYYVKPEFRVETREQLNKIERQAEDELHNDLRQSCFREKTYKETAIWRARNYGDERLLRKAHEYETPSCTRINHIFGGG